MEIFLAAVFIGLIPAFVAHSKGRSFVAWWLYGAGLFIFALPHALLLKPGEGHGSRKCPYCAELVKEEARVCRYCGRNLPQYTRPREDKAEEVEDNKEVEDKEERDAWARLHPGEPYPDDFSSELHK